MQLPVTRRLPPRESTPLGTWALLGFGAGFAIGFLLSESFGTGGKSRASRLVKGLGRGAGPPESPIALAARVKAALEGESWLAGESIEPLPAGRVGIALHGWVANRAVRTRAWRMAQAMASPEPVANRILVRGEDDGPALSDPDREPRSA